MKKALLFTILMFHCCGLVYPQIINDTFERISTKDGLSQSTVNYIIQDSKGFMWFATYAGINKYDGYNFKTFIHNEDDSASLTNNDINFLFEDHKGSIWIVPESKKGLERFDPETEKFTLYTHNPEDSTSISSNEVLSVSMDKSGNTWICTANALNLVIREKINDKTVIRFKRFYNTTNTVPFKMAYENSHGQLLLCAEHLYYINRENNEIIQTNVDLIQTNISSISEDKKGNLWIGTLHEGLIKLVYNKETESYSRTDPGKANVSPGTRNYIVIDHKDRVWIATESQGLYLYDEKEDRLTHFLKNENDLNSISDNTLRCLCIDNSGILWIGTFSQGLCKYDLNRKQFYHIKSIPRDNNSLGGNVISSIHSTTPNEIWVGVDLSGGVSRLIFKDDHKPQVINYKLDQNKSSMLNSVLCLAQRENGDVWVGSASNTISIIQPEIPFANQKPVIQSINHNGWPFAIFEDRDNTIWVGSWGSGLARYNSMDQVDYFTNDPQNPESICENIIWAIAEDYNGNIWIGGHGEGLSILPVHNKNDQEPKFINFKHEEGIDLSLSNNTINVFYQDVSGTMWIGTNRGLNKVIRQDNNFQNIETESELVFHSYKTKDGLPSDGIIGIVEDNKGNLWLSTGDGISKFNIQNETFSNYNESDGLQSNEFRHNSYFKDQNGKMYFGGFNGINTFYPDSIKLNPFPPKIVFTDFKLFYRSVQIGKPINDDVILSKSINNTSEINLSYKNNVFSIEFAALQYTQPEKNEYAYTMEGFDKEWVRTSADFRFASYTNLPAGKYTFRVKASNDDGIWNEEGASMAIIIHPPFWQTPWFRIISLICIGLLIFGFIEYRTYGIKKQRQKLEQQVKERTKDLQTANRELGAQKRQLQKNTMALKKSNEELEQFAYVASHDLQEPLRMVSSYVSLLAKRNEDHMDSDSKEFVAYAQDGTKRMQILIQDLLNYSRVTTQAKPFEPIETEQILKTVLTNLSVIISDTKSKIIHSKLPTVQADHVQLERLFQNLIGNAIKYNQNTPEIHISAENNNGKWLFAIKDNGIGIDPQFQDRIFGIFKRLHGREEYSGTGIGLAICKKIVERHGGKIWVESEGENKGSTFYFTISIHGDNV